MNIRTLTTLLIFYFTIPVSNSQERLVLSTDSAIEYALQHNRLLKNSNYAIEKSQQSLIEAIANGLPQVNAVIDYSNSMGAVMTIRFDESMPASEIPIKPSSNLNLTVSQLVFSGNYIVGVQTANLARKLSTMNLEKSESDVVGEVLQTYYLLLVSHKIYQVLSQNVINLEDLYKKTSAMEKVGMIEKTNLDQLEIQLNTIKNSVKASERQLELAKNMLRLQLGVTSETEIELSNTLDEILEVANFDNLILNDFNIENNIDYKLIAQQELISKKMIDMKRANALPTVSAFYRYTYKILKPNFDMSPKNVIGLQINIPIFSSGVRMAQVKQAKIDYYTVQNNKDLIEEQLKIQEKQLIFNFNNAIEAYHNQLRNIEVSRRVYESLKLKYAQGMISGLDLTNADNNYLRAENDYISSIMEVLSSSLQLRKLYGNLNIEK
jgi:outer membrane protein TolC